MTHSGDRLRAVQGRVRAGHQRLYELQEEAIADLREALDAVSKTHDALFQLFQADAGLEDLIDEGDDVHHENHE